MDKPLVSVIIPVYNTEKYLRRCIDSLLAQTYENLEFIFVDDGSPDDSKSILLEAEKKDRRIRWISQENRGLSGARNSGVKIARGEFLLFCDSDDTVEPTWAERLTETARQHPDALVVCGMNLICDWKQTLEKTFAPKGDYAKEEYYTLIKPGVVGSVCIKVFRRELFLKYGLQFDETVKYAEDVVFTIDYLAYVSSIYVIEDTLYNYYQYDPGTRHTITSNITCAQMRYIYEKRLPLIGDRYLADFNKMYFGNLWQRFLSLEERKDIPRRERMREAGEILADPVFRQYLCEHGQELFDPSSLRCLKGGDAKGYYLRQKLSLLKRKLMKQKDRSHTA